MNIKFTILLALAFSPLPLWVGPWCQSQLVMELCALGDLALGYFIFKDNMVP